MATTVAHNATVSASDGKKKQKIGANSQFSDEALHYVVRQSKAASNRPHCLLPCEQAGHTQPKPRKPEPIKKVLLAAAACAALSAPAHSGTDEPTLADFNALFKNTVAMGKQTGAPIKRFNETNEVGWEQVVIVGDVAVKIVVIVSPPSTFAIKHLCMGNTHKPAEMLCTSNLGETWVDTKDAAGNWHQSQIVNLSGHRDLAALAFD